MIIRLTAIAITALLFSLPISAAVDKQLLSTIDLQRALFSDQYIKLKVAEQDLLVVLNENTNAIARGVAILLTQGNTTLTSNQGLAPLVGQLTQLGWVTMLVPSPATEFLTARELLIDGAESPLEPASVKMPVQHISQATFDEHLEKLSLIMQAALEKAKEYPGFILVIAQGTSAASLTQLYAQQTLPSPDALVVIAPFWPDRIYNNQLATELANTSMPVLDLFSTRDNTWSLTSVDLRKVATVKALKLQYRQRQIIGSNDMERVAPYISKEIYGWLSHMGW
ncbi:DUF3530 family protein [Paraglaciecola sp. 25GB23A]|uniref:DUF3530 family protein n=1 Tax=Paraglaciecola sp. 25GB23A TaxID=3156068 RepID=UPI0032AEE9D6